MERVIVSVKRADLDWSRDLELPAELPMTDLVAMVAKALRWPTSEGDGHLGGYLVEARPSGRELGPADTLAGTGVWDGAWLIFHPDQSTLEQAKLDTSPPDPSKRWRRVDEVSGSEPSTSEESFPGDGFAWKRLDED